MKNELEDRMDEIKKTGQQVRQQLKDMEVEIAEIESSASNTTEYRIRKVQFCFLSHRFTEIMAIYNIVQIEHRENCKKRIQRQLEITGKNANDEEIELMLESGNAQIFTEGVS